MTSKKRPKNGCEGDYGTCGSSAENICYPANERGVDNTKIIGGIFVEIKKKIEIPFLSKNPNSSLALYPEYHCTGGPLNISLSDLNTESL